MQIKEDIRQKKVQRKKEFIHQKQAYDKVLQYLKSRDSIPVAEEKMLLDGLKLILDNGWTIGEIEIIQLMEMCGLKTKVYMDEKYMAFLEFLFYLSQQFGFDLEKITQQFEVQM